MLIEKHVGKCTKSCQEVKTFFNNSIISKNNGRQSFAFLFPLDFQLELEGDIIHKKNINFTKVAYDIKS